MERLSKVKSCLFSRRRSVRYKEGFYCINRTSSTGHLYCCNVLRGNATSKYIQRDIVYALNLANSKSLAGISNIQNSY